MKTVYAAVFGFVAMCLLFCIRRVKKDEKAVAVTVKKLLGTGTAVVVINIAIVLTNSQSFSVAAYSLYFACMDIVLYYLFRFTLDFSGIGKQKLVNLRLWRILLWIDAVCMLLNPVARYAFDCKSVLNKYGELCFKPVFRFPFYFHLFLCYMLIAFGFTVLIYKLVKSSELYREKYVFLLVVLAFIVLANAIYLFTEFTTVNISIIAFAIGGILIYYYSVEFVPRELLKRTLTRAVQGMTDAVFVFDEDGRVVHINDRGAEMLKSHGKTTETVEGELRQWRTQHAGDGAETSWDLTSERDGRKIYLKIISSVLRDDDGCYIGNFFTVQDRTQEMENLERERYQANHDQLTGLYNRQCFYRKAAQCLAENTQETFLIVCSDIRQFKLINDVFGQDEGDALLKALADELRTYTRPGDVYGRLENDRFALLMRKRDYHEDIFVEKPANVARIIKNCHSFPIRICVGVYEVDNRSLPISGMCDRAFLAISTIKDKYDCSIAYYDDALRKSVLLEQELTGELAGAIATGQFRIYLQPQVRADGKVVGAEALVRWKHPIKGMISPAEFISVFEKNGSIVQVDRYVWELACRQLAEWEKRGRDDLYLSVNISPKDFYFIDVCRELAGLIEKYKIKPGRLRLEITETAVMANLETQLKLIAKLRDAGFVVEMDDFGSGYSSLNMLKDIRVDVLKIDMAFLGKTDDSGRAEKILQTVVQLSGQLGMPVVTEGVETETQVKFLQSIGCDVFQGYYFARPMEVSEFEEKFMNGKE